MFNGILKEFVDGIGKVYDEAGNVFHFVLEHLEEDINKFELLVEEGFEYIFSANDDGVITGINPIVAGEENAEKNDEEVSPVVEEEPTKDEEVVSISVVIPSEEPAKVDPSPVENVAPPAPIEATPTPEIPSAP